MVLMLQKEVVDRIMAQAPKMNLLALSVQFYAEVEKLWIFQLIIFIQFLKWIVLLLR